MESEKKIIIKFTVTDEENEILNKAYEIIKNARNKFLTSKMSKKCDEANIALVIINQVRTGVEMEEINE